MRETHNRKINEEDDDETLDTSYKKDEEKYEGMTLDSKQSTLEPPNNDQVIDSYVEIETTENFWKTTKKPRLTTIIPTSA